MRLSLYSWILTEKRKELKKRIQETADGKVLAFSDIIEKALEEYLKAHATNPYFKLEQFPGMMAYPSPWKDDYGLPDLQDFEVDELDDMIERLYKSLDITKSVRNKKRTKEIRS